MNIEAMPQTFIDQSKDYERVCDVIRHIKTDFQAQPSLEELAASIGTSPIQLQRLFTRWAGLTPKAFLQAVTLDHAKRLLGDGLPLLDASFESGLSGPGRLHDLFVTHEAMSPGVWKAKGAGLEIRWGRHASLFGQAVIMITDRGLAGLAFEHSDPDGQTFHGHHNDAFEDLAQRWPNATYIHDQEATEPYLERIFDTSKWQKDQPLRIVLIGSDFQIRVWESLLDIPLGKACTYSDLARSIGNAKASRAVGAAVGKNPISFVVPCHRALGKSGALTGYHWGLTRKRAMLGWEQGQVERCID